MELTVTEWLDELEDALEYRRIYGKEDTWQVLEECFYNDPKSNSAVGPNLIWSEGDALLSSLIVPDPEITLEAKTIAGVQTLPIAERLVNNLLQPDEMNTKAAVEPAVLNSYIKSKAIIKLGYDSEWGWDPKYDIGDVDQPLGMSMTQFDKKGNRIEYKNVKAGMPWNGVVDPYDFLVPWGTGPNLDDAPWVAHRIIRENTYFKKDPKYSNTSRLEPQMSMRDFMSSYSAGHKSYRDRTFSKHSMFRATGTLLFNEVWEIHDRIHQKIYCVCFNHDKFLRNVPHALMKALGGAHQFIAHSFVRHSRAFWAPPLAYFLGQHQADQFDLHLQIGKQRRINVTKFLMLEDSMSPEEEQKLLSGDVGAIAKVKKNVRNLDQVFKEFPKADNVSLLQESEIIRKNARDAIGFSRNQMGEYDASSRRTASEAMYVAQGAASRFTSKEDVVRFLYREVGRKALMLVQAFWTSPRNILVDQEWYSFVGSKIEGEFAFKTSLHTRSSLSKPQRMMQAMQMTMFFAQFPNVNMEAIQKHILAAVNDPSFEGFFTPPQGMNIPQGASAAGGLGQGQQEIGTTLSAGVNPAGRSANASL